MADRLGLSDHLGYQPLFCIPVRSDSLEDFWFRAWSASPRKPEEILLVNAPDDLPVPMDVVKWTSMMADATAGRHSPCDANWDVVLSEGDPIATDWLLPPGCDGCSVARIGIGDLGCDWSWVRGVDDTRSVIMRRRVEFALKACDDVIHSGHMEFDGRIQQEVTDASLYGALVLSSLMPALWEEMTGNRVMAPVFYLTPQGLIDGASSMRKAQDWLLEWDDSLDRGKVRGIRFLRGMRTCFARGLAKVAESVARDLAKRAGIMGGDPCPCGSGEPYALCHGRISSIDDFAVT